MSYTRYADFVIHLRPAEPAAMTVEVTSSPVGELAPTGVALPLAAEALPGDPGGLRSLGAALFDSLFPAPVRALYRAALASLPRESGLRVLVQTGAAPLAAIPWEYAYDGETGAWLALDPRTPLVRHYALPFARGDLPRPSALRVLAALAAPSDAPPLDLAGERGLLEATFEPLQQAGRLNLAYLSSPVTVERLQSALRRGVDVLHYVGHGTQQGDQGALLLEREDGRSQLVLAEEVAMLLRRSGVRMVCLNACQTGAARGALFGGLGPALVQAEIPAVVAMQYPMPDQSALRFTRAFYGALADGEPVDAAVTSARISLRAQSGPGQPEWGYPVLFMRASDGHLWAGTDSAEAAPPSACPNCGRPARAQSRFCAGCGAALRPPAPQPAAGVQITGQASVSGIVAGQDAHVSLSGGDLVFGQGARSRPDAEEGPEAARSRPAHE